MVGVLRPNFQWTSEAMPIKQSLNMVLSMLLAFALPILAALGCYFTRNWFTADVYLGLSAGLLGMVSLGMTRWLDTRGAARFERL